MKYVPRVHGNGFIQLDMTSTRRLHIWGHPDIPRQVTATPLHDHAFEFVSRILLGRMRNVRYAVTRPSETGTDFMIHKVNVRDREDTTLHPTGEVVGLEATSFLYYYPGQTYAMLPGEIHDSQPEGLTVTVIEKIGKTLSQGGPSPRVFVPIGMTPDNTFHRYSMTPEKIWAIVAEVLLKAKL